MNDSPTIWKPTISDRIHQRFAEFKWFFKQNVTHRLIRFLGGVPADHTGNYLSFAKNELPGCKPDADSMDKLMADQIIELLGVFASHGHSGFSASFAVSIFQNLALFKPLGPLTGEDDEWVLIDGGDEMKWQNKRSSNIFKQSDGRAYNMDGRVFREPNGCTYTSKDSRVYIEFPYTLKTEYVDVESSND